MKNERKRLLAKVAYLYYVEDKSQIEISEQLDIYRTTVSRMIAKAKEEGIVELGIKDYNMDIFVLEEYVQTKYGLGRIEIIDNKNIETESDLSDEISKRAASLIRHLIREDDVVGISWGATLSKVVDKVEDKTVKNIKICPLAGGPSNINIRYHVNTLVYELGRVFQGKTTFINETVVSESEQSVTKFLNSSYSAELSTIWNNLDLAIVGIGGDLTHKNSSWRDLLTERDYNGLTKEYAVGEVCCRFVNKEGDGVYSHLQKRIVGLTLEQLAQVPKSVAVAYGESKAQAMLAVLKKKYVNHLVTDKKTILQVLALDGDATFNELL